MGAKRTAEREEFLADIITSAIEGGTGYWATTFRYRWDGLAAAERFATIADTEECDEWLAGRAGERATIAEMEEAGIAKTITIETIAAGLGKIKRGELAINSEIRSGIIEADRENDAGLIDAGAADCIAQAGLFGELIYG